MNRYGATIFLSAFLLFLVQPLIGKYVLPRFGGGPSVWISCMLFFQTILLCGYAYAHFTSTRLSIIGQKGTHVVLLVASLLFLPVAPRFALDPGIERDPSLRILWLLAVSIGVPFFTLSSTGPLIQRWFSLRFSGRSPYRLYALSNGGSLFALLSYPVVVEPFFRLSNQAFAWSAAYVGFVILFATCLWELRRTSSSGGGKEPPGTRLGTTTPPPGRSSIVLWIALPAAASSMLLAATNHLCLEVSVVPFLWVLPLSLYLITFIIAFDNPKWYQRRVVGPLFALATAVAMYVLWQSDRLPLSVHIPSVCAVLFFSCLACHGELVRIRPRARRLTAFYLCVALGGALGGVLVALVAPALFQGFWEYHLAIGACAALTLAAWIRDDFGGVPKKLTVLGLPLTAAVLVLFIAILTQLQQTYVGATHVSRSFYGVLRVEEGSDRNGPLRYLMHGRTTHGSQYTSDSLRTVPTTYYGESSGVGLALRHHPRRGTAPGSAGNLRVGVVGLGTGTLAGHLIEGDHARFYEIDPRIIELAQTTFTYLRDSPAEIEIVTGDARVQMENELNSGRNQEFDILILDAFSSDAIPTHLLTVEAGELYLRHLKPDGLLAIHISNQHLDFVPVVIGLNRELETDMVLVRTKDNDAMGIFGADWALLSRNEEFLEQGEIREADCRWDGRKPAPVVWTDSFASLWTVLSLGSETP